MKRATRLDRRRRARWRRGHRADAVLDALAGSGARRANNRVFAAAMSDIADQLARSVNDAFLDAIINGEAP